LEEAARFLRYEVLEAVARDEDADSIALAHHMDDQAETVLMNLFRGSGATGLSGIRPRQGMRIRPLLFATKKEILLYLKENKTIFVEDSTNFSKDHTRNRMRLELLPLIEELYPRAKSHIASAAEDIGVWRDHIEKEAKQIRGGIKGKDKRPNHGDNELKDSVLIDRQAFLKNPRAIREEWLRQAVAEVIPARKDVTRDHYLGIIDLLESEVTGRRIDLPRGCCAVRTYDGVVIGQKSATLPDSSDEKTETESFQRALEIPGTVKGPEDTENTYFVTELFDANIFNEEIDIFSEEKDYTKYIDYDKIEIGLVLRHPRKGDYFIMDGSGKKKKLSRYFIDQKVPKEQRSKELVIADGSHIVWALPDRLSEHYKVTENTTRVLKISRECEGLPVGKEFGKELG
jgi:tRNA(Ile)-lysidine synthase